jgi:hypothetical protein
MVKNILVAKNYKIADQTKWYNDRSAEHTLSTDYDQMAEIMSQSARHHIRDLDHIVIHTGEATDIREVFKIHFKQIYDLWCAEPCNILYCDLDVIFLKEVEYFNKFNHFSMFNLTDPTTTQDQHYGVKFNHYFNCGIRYYPHTMDQKVWQVGFDMLNNWNSDRWDAEQIIYNQMMFSQGMSAQQFYRPDLAFQMLYTPPLSPHNQAFNQIDITQASAVHVHGSRGSANRLQIMRDVVDQKFQEEILLL